LPVNGATQRRTLRSRRGSNRQAESVQRTRPTVRSQRQQNRAQRARRGRGRPRNQN
jgi:hypothetical protein